MALTFDLVIEPLAYMIRNLRKLKGFTIPNILNKVLINLFVDNTTIYLGREDRYRDLQDILSLWCTISRAKFNTTKMEIIPIGSTNHCTRVLTIC